MSIVRSHSKEGRRGVFGSGNGRLFWKMGAREGEQKGGRVSSVSGSFPLLLSTSMGDFEDVDNLSML